MDWIIERLNSVSAFFYDIYLEVYDWVWPFRKAAWFFYELHWLFWRLGEDCIRFNSWLSWADIRLEGILSLWEIYWFLEPYFTQGVSAWTWVTNAFMNVWNIIDDWWSSARYQVIGWIDEAVSGVRTLVDQTNTWLANLQSTVDNLAFDFPNVSEILAWFSNWTGNVLSIVNTWWTSTLTEVSALIDSAFIIRSDFWAGWQDWRDKVTEFFSDPEDWLYKAADRIIERFW